MQGQAKHHCEPLGVATTVIGAKRTDAKWVYADTSHENFCEAAEAGDSSGGLVTREFDEHGTGATVIKQNRLWTEEANATNKDKQRVR